MRTEVRAPDVPAIPGEVVVIEIDVSNTATVIDGVTARVDGLDPAWVHLPVPVLSLFPDTTGTLPLHVTFPSTTIVGEYLVIVHVESTIDPTRHEQHELWLRVEPVESATMRLRPSVITKGSTATIDAIVTNTGNVETAFTMSAIDETRALSCTATPLTLTVAPGGEGIAEIGMSGKRPWFAQTVARTVTVTARTPTLELRHVATFNQKPRIPRGLLTMALLAAIVALWAAVILFVVPLFRGDNDPTKVVATNFNSGGTTDVPLAAVAASVSGEVTARSTGDGLERITVEAYRVNPKEEESELIGSAATDEEGHYAFAALLPGNYMLRFSADGFNERWYRGASTEAEAEQIDLAPTEVEDGINIELVGQAGTMSGNLTLPAGADETKPITLTITRVDDAPAGEAPPTAGAGVQGAGGGEKQPEPIVRKVNGPFTITGLTTPATYSVRVEAKGFDPQQSEQELAGGESLVLNTVRLVAADGSIVGIVRSSAGQPLGNVRVTLTSGETTREAITSTTGDVGEFTIDRLETPRTYVLTLDHDSFGSQTIALELPAGKQGKRVRITLTGGVGEIAGTAFNAAGPFGGVTVTVSGGAFAATTSTLTTTGPDAGVGSYRVSDVPTPGTYTVTFATDGYVSETLSVGLPDPGARPDASAILRPSTAVINGTVVDDDGAVAGVTVELSDGATTLATATSSAPPGGYAFTNVAPGSYTVTFSEPDHAQRIVLVTVAAGDEVSRDVSLSEVG